MHKMPDEWSECLPDREESCRDQVLFYVHQDRFTYNGTTFTTIMNYNAVRKKDFKLLLDFRLFFLRLKLCNY